MTLAFDASTALIPIDMQQAFDVPASSNPGVDAQGLRLLSAWRAAGLTSASLARRVWRLLARLMDRYRVR